MQYFVDKDSVVRQIWGKSDTILFIFAGAAAEFALNKAVDWLYFTGRLPADPLGRLFSTVSYARAIVFSETEAAHKAIDAITGIHSAVEAKRGATIPDWAYRDVLFMLIDYSIRSFELLERRLTPAERQEVFDVFHRMGTRMGLNGLPRTYEEWQPMRQEHMQNNMQYGAYTADLFKQYRRHLGLARYTLLLQVQTMVVPQPVHQLLRLRKTAFISPIIMLYKWSRNINADKLIKSMLLPEKYKKDIRAMDRAIA